MNDHDFKLTSYDNYTLIEILIKEFDLIKAPKFSRTIQSILNDINYPNIILDLNSVSFIDSTGLGSLISLKNAITKHYSEVAVLCTNSTILKIFDIAKIHHFFKVFPEIDEAVKYIMSQNN